MEVVDWFNKFGPMGAMFIFLISAIIYHTKWLRAWQEEAVKQQTEERIRVDERNDQIRKEFITALEKQQNSFNFSMEKIIIEFKSSIKELVEKIDYTHENLSEKFDEFKKQVSESWPRHRGN